MIFVVPALLFPLVWLVFWARWLSKRYGCPRFVRYLPWAMGAAWMSGALMTALAIVASFGGVAGESVDPSQKARILAEGISNAMNGSAFSTLALGVSALLLLGLTWRYHWAARPPEVPRDPPYR